MAEGRFCNAAAGAVAGVLYPTPFVAEAPVSIAYECSCCGKLQSLKRFCLGICGKVISRRHTLNAALVEHLQHAIVKSRHSDLFARHLHIASDERDEIATIRDKRQEVPL